MVTTDVHGSLWLDLTGLLSHSCRIEVTPWSAGISLYSHLPDETVLLEPFESVGLALSTLQQEPGAQVWLASVPSAIREQLVTLERLFGIYHFPALWLMSRSPVAAELFLTAPLLFFALLERARSGVLNVDRLLGAMDEEPLVLLRLAGLIDTHSCLRLLDALPVTSMCPEDLRVVRHFVSLPGWEQVNHCTVVDIPLLKQLIAEPALLGEELFSCVINTHMP
ncbi:MAG: hypothetical protein JKY26_11475 [Pseudomonas sp.]|uniref:hypothetical protein n=1 Tax=Halopseudomonas sp. TaxID=2901191 RepID=UPI001A421E86|nr:hypothetical protein [Pseudomonas sp.]|tara:strand:- start:1027 stop:1695 length:669 start_codon:yes stop_codon:yes gene_type:complete